MKVAILGASGEIGARLAQAMLRRNFPVRAVSRHPGLRLARWNTLDFRRADLLDADGLAAALEGCEAVVNCAIWKDAGATDPDLLGANRAGFRNLLAACRGKGVKRLIHLSSIAVLPRRITHLVVDNPFSYSDSGDWYTRAKVETEKMALAARGAMQVTVLRPGVVYGPHMSWSEKAFSATAECPLLLPDIRGRCPAVHVDDVAGQCLWLLESQARRPKLLHGVHPEHPAWDRFYRAHAEAVGEKAGLLRVPLSALPAKPPVVSVPFARRLARWLWMSPLWHGTLGEASFLSGFKRRFRTSAAEFEPSPYEEACRAPNHLDLELYQSTGTFGPDLNGESLGFRYAVGLEKGVAQAAAWWGRRSESWTSMAYGAAKSTGATGAGEALRWPEPDRDLD